MREKLTQLRDDLKRVPALIAKAKGEVQEALDEAKTKLDNFAEYTKGWADEIGQQLFGMHLVQEMLCEKAGISKEDVKARIDAREAALAEQQRLLREASDKAHEAAEAEKAAQKAEAASTTAPDGGLDGGLEAPDAGPLQ